MSELTLYVDSNYDSPWAMSAFVALEEKRVPYALKTVTLSRKETFAPGFKARTRRIPSLVHQDFWLAESSAIAEYLEDVFSPPGHPALFPQDARERATCRELQGWLRTDLQVIRQERPTTTLWFQRTGAPLSADAQAAVARVVEAVDPLLAAGRATLFSSWCIADLDLALLLQRLNLNGTPLPAKLKAYAEANWARPSAAKWHALPRPPRPV